MKQNKYTLNDIKKAFYRKKKRRNRQKTIERTVLIGFIDGFKVIKIKR